MTKLLKTPEVKVSTMDPCDSPITFMSTTQPPFELPPAHHRIVFDDIRGDIIVAGQFDINWY